MSCCNTPYFLGCVNHCSTLSFGTASETTTLTGVFTFAGIDSSQDISIIATEPITVDVSGLNEYASYTLKFYDTDGLPYTVDIGGTDYDCFRFKTKVIYGQRIEPTDAVTACCEPLIIEVDGEETYTLTLSQWAAFGNIPEIQVVISVDGVYQNIAFEQSYDSMPTPTQITITLPGTPPEIWYIIVK